MSNQSCDSGRFARRFAALRARGEGAFVPFVNLCDPTPEASLGVLEALIAGGADALELGIPFSDPCADGPVIEASAARALRAGSTTDGCLAVVERLRKRHPDLPVSLMLYINLVVAPGLEHFMRAAARAGADAVLIPDLPMAMRGLEPEWDAAAAAAGLDLIAIAPPGASPALLRAVAARSKGYVYLLSRVGITGTEHAAENPQHEEIETLRRAHSAPLLLGFGVSEPEHVAAALAAGVDGVIAGSSVTKCIESHVDDPAAMRCALTAYVRRMKAAAKK